MPGWQFPLVCLGKELNQIQGAHGLHTGLGSLLSEAHSTDRWVTLFSAAYCMYHWPCELADSPYSDCCPVCTTFSRHCLLQRCPSWPLCSSCLFSISFLCLSLFLWKFLESVPPSTSFSSLVNYKLLNAYHWCKSLRCDLKLYCGDVDNVANLCFYSQWKINLCSSMSPVFPPGRNQQGLVFNQSLLQLVS